MRAIATVSSARSRAVVAPMNGLSECLSRLYTTCRWRFGTGTSTGSQMMPPERCMDADRCASLWNACRSSSVLYRRRLSKSSTNGEP